MGSIDSLPPRTRSDPIRRQRRQFNPEGLNDSLLAVRIGRSAGFINRLRDAMALSRRTPAAPPNNMIDGAKLRALNDRCRAGRHLRSSSRPKSRQKRFTYPSGARQFVLKQI
jgi:hypothetical protein